MELAASAHSDSDETGSLRGRITAMNTPSYMKWRWYHPGINGPKAEDLLLDRGKDGSFLVRPSRTLPGDFVLAVRENDHVTHIRIHNTGEFLDLYGGERFATLSEMIAAYYNEEVEERIKHDSGRFVELKFPLPAHDNDTVERWFHANVSSRDAENWLREKGHVGSFLVRESRRLPGNYVLSVRCETKVLHLMITCQNGKFSIEDSKEEFKCLKLLLRNYQKFPMVDKTGINIYLRMPFNSTRIKASQIHERVVLLDKRNKDDKTGFQEEYELLQAEECQLPFLREEGKKPENKPKNRYKNILPFDHTRVVLNDGDPNVPGSDYINANFLESPDDVSNEPKRYIATQGVNDATIKDLYRMMWQENCHVIIMATELVEKAKKKCASYWPTPSENQSSPVMEFDIYNGSLRIELKSETDKDIYILRELAVTRIQDEKSSTRTIWQYHFKKWPDHGVPSDPMYIIRLLKDVNDKHKEVQDAGPLVIHCSAGVGRTGCLIIVDMIMTSTEQIGVDREIDIFQVLKSCRTQRSGFVQTEPQYRLIYQAVDCGIQNVLDDIKRNQAEPVYENITRKARPAQNGDAKAESKSRSRGKLAIPKKKK
ncbi:tyrosine-protein phosphatase non-receptor type 11-like [Lineus longissimus]|uniref:tyrosine-protein phosphatase non-receptor type 11-like n=1 Tax=Lineus longissimus TaxID=88925 RepID=UPI002B4ED7AB